MTCTDVKERTEHVAPPDQCSLFSSTNVPIDAALNLLYIYSSLTFITCAFFVRWRCWRWKDRKIRHIKRHAFPPDEMWRHELQCRLEELLYKLGRASFPSSSSISWHLASLENGSNAWRRRVKGIQLLFPWLPKTCISREACLEYQAANPDFAHLKEDDDMMKQSD